MSTLINTYRAGFTVDPDALAREISKRLAHHELYDELDASPKEEARMFELLAENNRDDVLKAIGRIVWDANAQNVKREIDTMNEQIAADAMRDRAA
ncbi:hypothetical protein [Burkholderia pseudomallei]|uniref:hypothetical protein n=1 Tax=Burkholderia pseudomallei TaxID=28450 RepID=UPI000F06E49E|nr:hypothetical protein [Burkholderia pseudomallei]CAJ2718096.1 Uncharacterised protein [Burkholderia pseudomallei]VBX79512.1 Uncharacterised protein [Burkholderia pseudomallei]VBX79541.1 Uncharacterised protein [Burkholderia pseudomallei]VBX88901.1 Uncharacterised protein [Burkholderia pseudomallei]VBX90670.1 Uncharacterised protein [Burkholderia pseudomallei]